MFHPKRLARIVAAGLLSVALLLPIPALASHDPQDAFALSNEARIFGTVPPGGGNGTFAFYSFAHPGNKATVTVNLRVLPDDATLLRNVGFNVYSPAGALVVKGGARPGLDPNVSADVYAATPTTFLVQVYSYDPARAAEYEVWAAGLGAPAEAAPEEAAPEIARKIYRSAEHGIQVIVPESWVVRESAEAIEIAQPDNAQWIRYSWRDFGRAPTRDELLEYGRSLTARYGENLIVNEVLDQLDGLDFNLDFKDRPGSTGNLILAVRGTRVYAQLVDELKPTEPVFDKVFETFTVPWNVPAGTVVAREDWTTSPASRWGEDYSDRWAGITTTGGALEVVLRQSGSEADAAVPITPDPNVSVEVDAIQTRGIPGGSVWVACRTQGLLDDQYQLYVQPGTGVYGIGKLKDGEFTRLARGTAPEAVKPVGQVNRIKSDCVGDTLTLTVNGQQVAQVKDPDFQIGSIRLGASAAENGAGTIFRFDNLIIRKA